MLATPLRACVPCEVLAYNDSSQFFAAFLLHPTMTLFVYTLLHE